MGLNEIWEETEKQRDEEDIHLCLSFSVGGFYFELFSLLWNGLRFYTTGINEQETIVAERNILCARKECDKSMHEIMHMQMSNLPCPSF